MVSLVAPFLVRLVRRHRARNLHKMLSYQKNGRLQRTLEDYRLFHWLSPYLKAGAKRELRDRHQIAFQGRQGGVSTAKHGDGSLPFYIEVREIYRSQVGTAVQQDRKSTRLNSS